MPSFDIVSKTDMTSVDNALHGVAKEMQVRYDFKGSKSEVSKNDDVITILADDELKRRQVEELAVGEPRPRPGAAEEELQQVVVGARVEPRGREQGTEHAGLPAAMLPLKAPVVFGF